MNTQDMNNSVQYIFLSAIKTSSFNPRKMFNETDLTELADSIETQGVLQPIMVRPKDDIFEIVYGERRYKASLIAGFATIPAIVRELSDNDAIECALTENLQRKNISPVEEATAFQSLIQNNRYDISRLMAKFAKSESYIRSRLRLCNLIALFADLLISEEINLTVALELCKYSNETQEEIYEDHYATDNNYKNWIGKRAKDVVEMIERNYTANLNDYFFDKTVCFDCKLNSNTQSLFGDTDGCGRCLNATCLKSKNTEYIVERAITTHENNPELPLARTEYHYNEEAVEQLTDKEYDIEVINYSRECPIPPNVPQADDYETDEEYQQVKGEYEEELIEYQTESAELHQKYENGEIRMFAKIGTRGVSLGYVHNSSNGSTSNIQVIETPLMKLTKQDERNKEIEREKTIADTKILIQEIDLNKSDFTALEESITNFAMLKQLRNEHFGLMGIEESKYYLRDKERLQIVMNLTEIQKIIIRRDFIQNTLKDAFRDDATSELLLAFAEQHAPDALAEIKNKYNEVYERRHQRITEKIDAINAQSEGEETYDENDLPQEIDTDFEQE
ncbi:MAG: ParB/RepB/Spo0J family partition protein [Bacteroidia bacterium]|nr:ParB/RepB/Spo0J family partition protein [Bacteroidia bacterium]